MQDSGTWKGLKPSGMQKKKKATESITNKCQIW